jgi:glycerophosphoryl diester phosphodiesterase family protein
MTDLSVDARPLEGEIRIGHIFGRAWDVFTANFVKFVVITAIIGLPNLLFTTAGPDSAASPEYGWRVVVGIVLGFTLNMLAQAVILYIAFQYLRGQEASLGDAVQKNITRVLPLIGVLVLTGLGLTVGFLLLFIPGVMLLVRWSVAVPACVLDRTGPVASLKRSAILTKGHRWKIFGMFLLLWIVSMVVAGVIMMVTRPVGVLAGAFVGFIWTAIWSAYFNSVWVMLYHDLRVAKEGVDVEQIASVFD